MSDYYHNIEEELSFGMVRTDRVLKHVRHQRDRIEELQAESKRLNEQMDAIEEMGTESLNALPDCLMRLAPALVENDELKAKLAKAVEALGRAKASIENGGGGGVTDVVWLDDPCPETLCDFIDATLAELKGQDDG